MITGLHTLIYSTDADATRAFLRDVLGWPNVDAGDGWLIFKTPPAEMGVHPTGFGVADSDLPLHQLSLMCEEIGATVDDLRSKGVTIVRDVEDEGFGLVALIEVPGAGTMQVYEPRHDVAHSLPT